MNIWDIILLVIIVTAVALAVRHIIRTRKAGGCSCGGGSACGGSCSACSAPCRRKIDEK